jgi:hypothetical protein
MTRRPPGHDTPVIAVAFTADGRTVRSAGGDGLVLTWATASGKLVRTDSFLEEELARYGGSLPLNSAGVTLSGDARYAATTGMLSGTRVRFWDLNRGEDVCDFECRNARGQFGLSLSTRGERLAAMGGSTMLRIWDTGTGEETAVLTLDLPDRRALGPPQIAFAPDGKQIAVSAAHFADTGAHIGVRLLLLAVPSGKEVLREQRSLTAPGRGGPSTTAVAFTQDGRWFAFSRGANAVALVRADSGKEQRHLIVPGKGRHLSALAFSPDGRLLAAASGGVRNLTSQGKLGPRTPTELFVWELASGQLRMQVTGHLGVVNCLVFAPDCRTLASGGADATVLLWDLGQAQPPRALAGSEVATAWTELAQADAKAAFQAQRRLIGSPAEATAFIRSHLSAAVPPPLAAKQLQQWVENLGSEDFVLRDQARAALTRSGAYAEAALRQGRAGQVALETRRRIDELLDKLDAHVPSRAEVQALRALEVLERIATPEARALVDQLATGAPPALLTREASAAAARMTR